MGKTIQLYGFPNGVSVSQVKVFLERYTGEGTVYAIKIRPAKCKGRVRRAFAIVQFTTAKDAAVVTSLANKSLWFGSSYLKVREMEADIVCQPQTFLHTMEEVKLNFGYQVSKERFSFLWKGENVTVNFGRGMRKMQFLLSHNCLQYRLELSYANIWQIELCQPRLQMTKYLLVQLLGAPRIFEKVVKNSGTGKVFEDPHLNYFKDTPDDQWIRTVDFTPWCSIGQSSALCLELPYGHQLPNFRDNFAYYKENERQYIIERGTPLSCGLDLVPIVNPPPGIQIPYEILFKVNSLVQHGCLAGQALDRGFYQLVDPCRMDNTCIEHALQQLYSSKEFCYNPSKWLTEYYQKNPKSSRPPKPSAISLDDGLVYIHRVQITPCKVYFCGPEVNVSNRVLRHFHKDIDNFLRVSFVDEELDKMYSRDLSPRMPLPLEEGRNNIFEDVLSFLKNSIFNDDNTSFEDSLSILRNSNCTEDNKSLEDGRTGIYKRILSILRNGINIGDKKFEFLAFSSSQLRDNSMWMFASRNELTAADIREWMGNFGQIKNVAKYAARLGQSFGSSTEVLSVGLNEIEIIPDVEVGLGENHYVFSDGIGKISAIFARKVAVKFGYKGTTPSAFQIRYGGYKGVVAVDPTSSAKLSLRKSMLKYESDNTKLDVLGCSKFQPCFLNRQIITLLSTLGVKDDIFEKKQREAVNQLNDILTNSLKAQEALDMMSPGESTRVLKEMLICGYKPDTEPFLSMMLQTHRAMKLLDLRLKTRIFVPKGRAMMGCLDETRTLEYGQVFVQFSGTRSKELDDDSEVYSSDRRFVVKGKVVVAKNPCLHPGDVRVLRAVDVPTLHHMVDCVVFPQKGLRPHPNECSGSDLDGDIYFVCWDPELIPPRQIQPMDYSPPPSIVLDHEVTMEEVEEYFTNYMVNDSLGMIANAHVAFADKELLKAMSEPCIELAKLFSMAVDFPKTGVPAVIPSHLHVKEYPDFMEKLDKPQYLSRNVLGKLYREVKDIAPNVNCITSFTLEVATRSYDSEMEVDGFEDYVDDAFYYKSNYDKKLWNLMDYYGIKTEAEIISGNIMQTSRAFTKRRDSEAINMAVKSLRKEARTWFKEKGNDPDSRVNATYAKASAWYHVTYHPSYFGWYNEGLKRDHLLSFPWCVYDKLIHIKKNANSKRDMNRPSLGNKFKHGLRLE